MGENADGMRRSWADVLKFGQILSSRTDLLPAPLIKELEKLQDNVPPLPGEQAIRVVEHELQGKVADLFA